MKSCQSISESKKLSLEECLELGRRCADGDPEARERLILSHIYLVDRMKYAFLNKGVSEDDLFQEGCFGLLRAVDLYDHKRGVLFSTYAIHWIRKQMRMALRKQSIDKPIVLKDDEYWLLVKVCSCVTKWTQDFGYKPSCEEVANELDLSVEHTKKLLKLSQPFINIEDSPFVETSRSAEDVFFDKFLYLDDVPLTSREKAVLSRRLGFTDSGKEETLKEIAASLQLSYETVRLDYRSALHKIKIKLLGDGCETVEQ